MLSEITKILPEVDVYHLVPWWVFKSADSCPGLVIQIIQKKTGCEIIGQLFWLGVLLGQVFPCTLRRLVTSASFKTTTFCLSFLCYTVDAPKLTSSDTLLSPHCNHTGSTIIPSPTKSSQTPIIVVPPVARCQSGSRIIGGK